MCLYAGVDVGSQSTKAVLVNGNKIIAYDVQKTGADGAKAAGVAIRTALEKAKATLADIKAVVATGYGRAMIPVAARRVTEITCHARGTKYLFPEIKTVIDIGGQDSKVIKLDADGKVTEFSMNDKCAAGTGRFLEVMANVLDLSLVEMGEVALRAEKSIPISNTCTVFAESEVISQIHSGAVTADIVAGLCDAIASRITGQALRLHVAPPVAMTGGVAKNKGVVAALERALGSKLLIPDEPQIIGALGAALIAVETTVRSEV